MNRSSAAFPWKNGRPPHLPCGPGDVAEDVLVPGDPDRVRLLATMLEDVVDFGQKREFALVTGRFEGRLITICSTGIGGPSAEIALVELAMLGARHVVRIGGMSSLVAECATGTFVIVDKAIGDTGTARAYRAAGGSAYASQAISAALREAANELRLTSRCGTVVSTDSYYLGQGRRYHKARSDQDIEDVLLDRFLSKGAIGVEMESEAVMTVGSAIGLATGCLLGVHGNRATDEWLDDYEPTQRRLLSIAGRAFAKLKREPIANHE